MGDRRVDAAALPLDVGGKSMRRRVGGVGGEHGVELGDRVVESASGDEALRQDQARGRVMRIAREPVAADRNRFLPPARLAIEIGELGEHERVRLSGESLLGALDRGLELSLVTGHHWRLAHRHATSASAAHTSSAVTS